jgi:membrane protein
MRGGERGAGTVVSPGARPPAERPAGLRALGRALIDALVAHRTLDLAAQLAYWSLLALFPFLIFLLTVIGYLPLAGLDRALMREIARLMPPEAVRLLDQTIHEVIGRQRGGLLVLALAGALWSAASGVAGLVGALNMAHGVAETRSFLRVRLLSVAAVLGVSVAMLVATVGLMIGPHVVRALWGLLGLPGHVHTIWAYVRLPLSTAAMLLGVAGLYHFLPNVRQPFRLVTPGAAIAVVLWELASLLFRVYVTRFHAYARTYGTLGAAVVLITWLYLSALVVLLGGEIDALLGRRVVERAAPE